jgi:hypothetical protein
MLFVELDIKAANCKQESCSGMYCTQFRDVLHTQFDSGDKYLTFNFKFDNFVLCNRQTLKYNFGKLAKFDLRSV